MCQGLQSGIKQYHQDSIAISFITAKEMASTDNLNQLEPTFMYTQIFKDILLDMEHDELAIKDFITYCRDHNCLSPVYIDRFEKQYHAQLAIWWYSFPVIRACPHLRTMDADIIITMGFFLRGLHQQIEQLYQQQDGSCERKSFVVYRGQGLMKLDFEKLEKTKGGLISFNNFLSTSKNKEVSLDFAECASTKLDTLGIIFIMSIDPCIKSTPFASIKEESYFKDEDEILFSMHTVFRVNEIKQMENKTQVYEVELQLTSDDDQQLRVLTDRIREEAGGGTGWQRLGNLLIRIGQSIKAEELFNVLLEQTSDESERAHYYRQLGNLKIDQGDYEKAIWYNEKTLEVQQKTRLPNHLSLATSYNNIAGVYDQMGEYSKALSYYEKALEIEQKILPSNHPELATRYNNIGLVYGHMGEYLKALSYYEKALEIEQKILPLNHPDLVTSYNNIGNVYKSIGESLKALSFFEKALKIQQKAAPSNHRHLAISYNNIGSVYYSIKDYTKALSYLKCALSIYQRALPSTHPDINNVKENIEIVKEDMRKNS
ncbi:unnamed protein product [Adineta steineri]|uniref:NAD(P)(+)--arginine ADP-ribosyltransferase n=1 Tax=Adineta steineri TaxID=433720 RepID=A0A813SBL7_9BILA|nr:unnamed protein product [Adineta steineri]